MREDLFVRLTLAVLDAFKVFRVGGDLVAGAEV